VEDTTPPVIACPAPAPVECTGSRSAQVDPGVAQAADACSSVDVAGPSTGSFPVGTTPVVFTATDRAGLRASCTAPVTVVDTTPPTVTCPAPVVAECTGGESAEVDPGKAVASDTCGTVRVDQPGSSAFPVGTSPVTYAAVDEAGLVAVCQTSVTVQDTTPPTIACPVPVLVECRSARTAVASPGRATASDSCTTVTVASPGEAVFPMGSTTVSHTATDRFGNVASCQSTVTVIDTTAPLLFNLPAPIVAEATGRGTAVTWPEPAAFDACDGMLPVTSDAPAVFPLGTTQVTFTVTDAWGNRAHAMSTVTVVDTTAPVLAGVPAPRVVEQRERAGTRLTLPMPTAGDSCDGTVAVTSDAPAVFPPGITIVTFLAADAAGNKARATTTVTVVDTTPPAITRVDATPNLLSVPDHRLIAVSLTVAVTDVADPAPVCRLASVASNEREDGLGDGDTAPDWTITGPLTAQVRAERSGKGGGRVYTLTVRCTDAARNVSTATATVSVPHGKDKELAERQ
jgi:hypothetical protein